MGMEHRERCRWVGEIARINEKLNEEAERGGG